MAMIAKNSGVSIGLAVILGTFIFMGGMALGSIRTTVEAHQLLETHEGAHSLFIPRTEATLQFDAMQKDIEEIKATQLKILIEVRK